MYSRRLPPNLTTHPGSEEKSLPRLDRAGVLEVSGARGEIL